MPSNNSQLLNLIDQLMQYEHSYSELLQVIRNYRDAFVKYIAELRDLIRESTDSAGQAYKILKKFIMDNYAVRMSNIYFAGFEKLESFWDFQSFVDMWKEVHEEYLTYFANAEGMQMRMKWWKEKSEEAQLISDLGKIFHDLAVILTYIHNLGEGKGTLQKPLITLILPRIKQYSDVSVYLTGTDTINIQAQTGHSVKVMLNGVIDGQIGDYSPLSFLQASLDLSKLTQEQKVELYIKLCNLIAELISYEQNISTMYNPLVRAIDDLLEDLQIYMINTHMHKNQKLSDAIRDFLDNPTVKTAQKMYQQLDEDMKDRIQRLNDVYVEVARLWKEMVSLSSELLDLVEEYGKLEEGTDYDFTFKIESEYIQAINNMFHA